jgi:hypothetical protein
MRRLYPMLRTMLQGNTTTVCARLWLGSMNLLTTVVLRSSATDLLVWDDASKAAKDHETITPAKADSRQQYVPMRNLLGVQCAGVAMMC